MDEDWRAEILASVSRETGEKLDLYVAELRRWQRITNLVGPKTLATIWERHVADSLQLVDLAEGESWADIGSGAGFPGLAVAITRPGVHMTLIESDGRKCAFLRHVARVTGTTATVLNSRAEAALAALPTPDIVSARAVAPLRRLLELCRKPLEAGATGLFPKGRSFAVELTHAAESWRFDTDVLPSRVDREGRILRIRNLSGRAPEVATDEQP